MIRMIAILALPCLFLVSVPAYSATPKDFTSGVPSYAIEAKEISRRCDAAIDRMREEVKVWIKSSAPVTFENSFVALEAILADFALANNYLGFFSYVHPDEKVRNAGQKCEEEMREESVEFFSRRDAFERLVSVPARKLSQEDAKLSEDLLRAFRLNGVHIEDPKARKKLTKLNKDLTKWELRFDKNIRDDKTVVHMTEKEMIGVPENFKSRLERTKAGEYILTMAYPDYFTFMDNASDAQARKKYQFAFHNRAVNENLKLLKKILASRLEVGKLLGFSDYATAVMALRGRMAKSPQEVRSFLSELHGKLAPLVSTDISAMQKLKCGDSPECKGEGWKTMAIQYWDVPYYENEIRKRDHMVDSEKVKEYFPLSTVTQGMLEIYETLLGLRFKEVTDAPAWHESVKMFRVDDAKTKALVGYFYMDLHPRPGKYQHAAAFSLRASRNLPGKAKEPTLAAMVANFSPPTKDNPSLLSHDEVETYFHEFGHIMHELLSDTKYATHGGANVQWDFVEAPSQMLENWVWNAKSLRKLSGHYKTGEKLPESLLKKMIAAKNVLNGIKYSRQIMYGMVDMEYHTRTEPFDTTKVWADLMQRYTRIPHHEGTHSEASFGHLTGYDAGYYGYLWSLVFAQDMFTRFEKGGILSPKIGMEYRTRVLEPGGTKDARELIVDFLGREPNQTAFLKNIGL